MENIQLRTNGSPETVSDRFSFRRMLKVASFHGNSIEKQVLLYLILSVVTAICTLLPLHEIAQVGLYTVTWTILGLLVYMAPCILAKSGDSRIIERLLPASASEKYAFRILYFLLFIPVATYLLPYAAAFLYLHIPSIQTPDFDKIIHILFTGKLSMRLINLFTGGACILTCLYTVTVSRTNRILKGILSVFAIQIAGAILGAIWGISTAFRAGFEAGLSGDKPCDELTQEQFVTQISQEMFASPYFMIVIGITAAYFLLMLYLNYRILKKQNL